MTEAKPLVKITRKAFMAIHRDYRGVIDEHGCCPEHAGKRSALSGAIDGLKMGYLAIEGVHFEIVEKL